MSSKILKKTVMQSVYLVNVFLTVEVGQWTIYDERYLKPKQNAQLLYQPPAHLFVPPSSLVHYSYMNHFDILWGMDVLIIVNLKVNPASKIPYYDKGGSHTPGTFFLLSDFVPHSTIWKPGTNNFVSWKSCSF